MLERADDIEVVGEADCGATGTDALQLLSPDVVLLDIALPDMDGIELLKLIRSAGSSPKVIMYSCQSDGMSVSLSMESGADGYLAKSSTPRELTDAVRGVVNGQSPLSADASTGLISSLRERSLTGVESLTERERDVWSAVATGLSNSDIARKLFISEHTVKFHVHNILRKLGLKSRAEAICAAHRRGMQR